MRSSESRMKRARDSDIADGQPQPIKCNCQSSQGGTCLSEAMVRKIVREELQQWHLLRKEVAEEVEHQFQKKVRTEVECAPARIDSPRFDRRYGHQRSTIHTTEGSTSAAAYAPSCSHNFMFPEVTAQKSQKISKRWAKVKTAFQICVFLRKEAALIQVEKEMLLRTFGL
ncbi:hypothetical protein Ancab_033751 [Ancistrocladus abbreviatus]